MLQQTRVAAVIPYYERFLERFPDAQSLADASEEEVLRLWSGLGYYSRARNLQKAARQIVNAGEFPTSYEGIRSLGGVGDYTAAAISSIAFNLPHAVVDGNVRRVLARIANDSFVDARREADRLLDRRRPGLWNQALMELGAVICTPKAPGCCDCPLSAHCEARREGTQAEVPGPKKKPDTVRLERTLLVIERRGRLLMVPSTLVRGFWDLPDAFAGADEGKEIGRFRHSILNRNYLFDVRLARVKKPPDGARWVDSTELNKIPLGTTARKALRLITAARYRPQFRPETKPGAPPDRSRPR